MSLDKVQREVDARIAEGIKNLEEKYKKDNRTARNKFFFVNAPIFLVCSILVLLLLWWL